MNLSQNENRSNLLKDFIHLSYSSLFSGDESREIAMNQTMSQMVKARLLSADESYALKDRLSDKIHFDSALDFRIEAILQRKGLYPQVERRAS